MIAVIDELDLQRLVANEVDRDSATTHEAESTCSTFGRLEKNIPSTEP